MSKKRFFIILLIVLSILFIPLIAMQFTDEVKWGLMDFLIGGFLLLGLVLILNFIIRKIDSPKTRIGLIVMLVILFLLIWAELAVGIFGMPFGGS